MQRSLTNATEVDTSKFAEKADLPNLKSDNYKIVNTIVCKMYENTLLKKKH